MKSFSIFSMIAILLLMSLIVNSCMKENGKKKYFLRLEFSSGDVLEKECHVFERYKRNTLSEDLKGEKNSIYLDIKEYGGCRLYKVDNRFLTGIGYLHTDVSNFNMINNQSGRIIGALELEAEFEQPFRKYTVENGTFKFRLYGSLFNVPDSTYNGKWTLKRK